MPSTNPHTSFAKTAFSISGASGLYDRARPNYPPAALSHILSLLPTTPARIVELGSGTGLFSRMLLEAGKGRIESLVCVEPAQGMREGFKNKLGDDTGGAEVRVVEGRFDEVPVETGKVDMVIAAQAFHWVGHDGASSTAEIARVLRPGGSLVLIWNLEDRSTPWVAQCRDAYERFEAGTPQYRHGYWKSIFATPEYEKSFGPFELRTYHRRIPATTQLVVDRVLSKSFITALEEEEQREVLQEVRRVVEKGDGKVWIDQEAGTFEYPYSTDMYVMERV